MKATLLVLADQASVTRTVKKSLHKKGELALAVFV